MTRRHSTRGQQRRSGPWRRREAGPSQLHLGCGSEGCRRPRASVAPGACDPTTQTYAVSAPGAPLPATMTICTRPPQKSRVSLASFDRAFHPPISPALPCIHHMACRPRSLSHVLSPSHVSPFLTIVILDVQTTLAVIVDFILPIPHTLLPLKRDARQYHGAKTSTAIQQPARRAGCHYR